MDNQKFDVNLKDRRNSAIAIWKSTLCLAEMTQMKGNFWKTSGFTLNQKNYLHPEEALYLMERSLLIILNSDNSRFSLSEFYQEVLKYISLSSYLAYLKLKSLNYIAFRHSRQNIHSFKSSIDVIEFSKKTDVSVLDSITSFDVYVHTSQWSKKNIAENPPDYYFIIMDGEWTLNGLLMVELLDLSKEVPLLFAHVSPTGGVLLQEFSNAEMSLVWDEEEYLNLSVPCTFHPHEQVDVGAQILAYRKRKNGKNDRKRIKRKEIKPFSCEGAEAQVVGFEGGGGCDGRGKRRSQGEATHGENALCADDVHNDDLHAFPPLSSPTPTPTPTLMDNN